MGATYVYEKYILPNVQKYEGKVKDVINENIPMDQLKEMAQKA
jgi:hypothetical protein